MLKVISAVGDHPQAEQIKNVEFVREKSVSNCYLTVRMVADELGMNSERDEKNLHKNVTKAAE